jgi:hypothetical protein
MFSTLSRIALALGLATALTTAPAAAQCGPDNLDGGPCCAPASAVLPNFPKILGTDARWLAFDNCNLALNKLYCVDLGKPMPLSLAGAVYCGQYNIRLQLRDCPTGVLHWSGGLRAQYSRNWQESSIPGAVNLTVWRFIVNGDLVPSAAVPMTPLDRPASLGTYSRLYVSGHIDYALDCATGQWSVAWAVSHECDQIHHTPASARPAPAGGFDPAKSFSIVGPGTGFVPTPVNTPISNGPIVQGSIRWNNWAAGTNVCTYREPANGSLTALAAFCLCANVAPAAGQFINTFLTASGICGTQVMMTPNNRFTQKRIGTWNNPAVFPGIETVLFDFGSMQLVNGCTGAVTTEWYEGSETIGGFPAFDWAGTTLGRQFEDYGSCNTSPTSAAIRIGAPHVTNSILNFNLP